MTRRGHIPVLLAAYLCTVTSACTSAGGESHRVVAQNTSCTHDEALLMGAQLHEEFDVGSKRWRQGNMSDEEVSAQSAILIDLIDASNFALRGDDNEACRRYRKIAAEQGVILNTP